MSRNVNAALYRKRETFSAGFKLTKCHRSDGKESQWGEHVYREGHAIPFTGQLHWLAHRNLRACYLVWRADKLSSSRSSYTQQSNHFTCLFQFGGLRTQKLHLQSFISMLLGNGAWCYSQASSRPSSSFSDLSSALPPSPSPSGVIFLLLWVCLLHFFLFKIL